MIATDKLLFLHLHKSGGTFVNTLLLDCIASAQQVGYHLPYREAPSPYRSLSVLGTVRNPWAYYVSWYHLQSSLPDPNILFRICSNSRMAGFAQTIFNLIMIESDEKRLSALKDGLPDHYSDHGLNLIKSDVDDLKGSGKGFYTFLYDRLYSGSREPTILPLEGLRETLGPALESLGHADRSIDRFLEEVPPLNISRHNEPATYYDADLAALIADRDCAIIDRYKYKLHGDRM